MTTKYPIAKQVSEVTNCDNEKYLSLYNKSVSDPEGFWSEQAESIFWFEKWNKTFEFDYYKADIKWFIGGKTNVAYNCLDRHLDEHGDKTAIIWEDDSGKNGKKFTFKEVHREVSKMANILKRNGVGKGDRVAIYMGMIPEIAFAMLACARIGAIHSVIFGGFSKEAIRTRVLDSECKMLITANEGLRGSKAIPLKDTVDKALEGVECIEKVLVVKRTETPVNMQSPRDIYYHEEIKLVDDDCPAEVMDSEDPLFILYTSGSTGTPKGVLHTQAGYILYASLTHRYVFDIKPDDVYFCAADAGWITGHSYIVYGPLANATTTIMFESVPNYPDAGRYWDIVEKYKVNIFYTAPTAIRAIAKEGDEYVKKYDRSSLRVLGSVGEPINKDAWEWYYNVVGEKSCALVDTWWQTETGGIAITPLPGATETKPGSATRPFFGIQPCLVDEKGNEIEGNSVEGRLCIKHSWPGQMRTVYGNHERFIKTYFSDFPGKYFSGDGARRDEDGYYWITGRVDDVLNVSGHRLGTAEIESAIVSSGEIAEVAVIGVPHDIKGEAVYAFAIPKNDSSDVETIKGKINAHIRETIGAFARPDRIELVAGLPKTRSGKIMRRILRKIASGEKSEFGDTSTLADPSIVNQIVENYHKVS